MFEAPQDLILPSLVLPIVTLITIILLINFRLLRRNYEGKNIPPGSFGLPFIGETLSFVKAQKADRGSQWIEKRVSRYGPIFKTKLMGSPTVIVAGQAGHKYVFTADGNHLSSKQPPSIVKISGKNNIFELTGSRYQVSINPIFRAIFYVIDRLTMFYDICKI
ncbi:hypothetical protein QJS04_geneDACA005840 [Acorus gramineus]|uniref:Cytochrome P450 n=1 Tax=Acorus gramineus TaxID=55184 RepID=A0AAV9B2E7_ACOGR|nr:hypothetical protein QJS04_geneDACA005840 [Acorus gramineus]